MEKAKKLDDPFKGSPLFLEAFRKGHTKALEGVYLAFGEPLRGFIRRGFTFSSAGRSLHFSGYESSDDVEDIVQETFRRAFGVRARASFDGVRPFKNYLFTIARNAVITDLTLKQRQVPVGDDLELEGLLQTPWPIFSSYRPSLEQELEQLEVFGIVAAFYSSLTEAESECFYFRFLECLSQERAANALGWNRSKVRKIETRLRRSFLQHLRGSGYLEERMIPASRRSPARTTHFPKAREIWKSLRTESAHEFLFAAA